MGSNHNHNNIYYTKTELNQILSKKEQQVNDNSKSLINYISNKNNNELYYLKYNVFNKHEINSKFDFIINKLIKQNYNDLYYVKHDLYNKNDINKITNKLTNFI